MKNSNPAIDPCNNDSLTGLMVQVLRDFSLKLACAQPAQVLGVEEGPPKFVSVVPLIQTVPTDDGTPIDAAQIARIPVMVFGAGGFLFNFPIAAKDFGWILANDRDISGVIASGGASAPPTNRLHDLADSVFFPSYLMGYTTPGGETGNFVLQNTAGDTYISIGNGEIKIVAGTLVRVTAPLFAVEGNITASGSITPDTPPPP